MAASVPNPGSSRKCGVVLTCFDNGRKRFRSIPVDATDTTGTDDLPAATADSPVAEVSLPVGPTAPGSR